MTKEEARKIMSAFYNGYEYPFGNGHTEDCDMVEVERHAKMLEELLHCATDGEFKRKED